MDRNQYIVAIEIGSSKIVGAIAEKTSVGLEVEHLEVEDQVNIVRYGCVQNVESTKTCVNKIIKKLENRIDGKIKEVYVGVSGRSVHSQPGEITRNIDSSTPITNDVVNSIINSERKDSIGNYETIEIVPRTYFVDKTETQNPTGQFGSSLKIEYNRIVARTTIMLNLSRVIPNDLKVKGFILTPLAVGKEILNRSELLLGCMLVDFGAETTTVSIYKNNALQYLTTLPMGGRNITHDMHVGLNIVPDTAEKIKRNINNPLDENVTDIVIEGVRATDAAGYIAARTGEIVANIKAQFEYAGIKDSEIQNVVLIGGAARMQGFEKKLAELLGKEVRTGSYPDSINILNHDINRPEYVQAFALLSAANEIMPEGESCLERIADNGGFTVAAPANYSNEPIEPEAPQVEKKEPRKPKKPSAWSKLKDRLNTLMNEDDEEDDDE